jgi:hypothetical protein
MLVVAISIVLSCKKRCPQNGQFEIPLHITITNMPSVKLMTDTITISATLAFKTHDLRMPSIGVSTETLKPSPLYFDLSAWPAIGTWSSPPFIPFRDGYFEVRTIVGNRISKNLYYDFEKCDTAWKIKFLLIPLKAFNGLYVFHTSRVQFKNECVQIDPLTQLINTPKSHNLIKQRVEFQVSPGPDDVCFYVE